MIARIGGWTLPTQRLSMARKPDWVLPPARRRAGPSRQSWPQDGHVTEARRLSAPASGSALRLF
jgi:hypothetical protein